MIERTNYFVTGLPANAYTAAADLRYIRKNRVVSTETSIDYQEINQS